MPEFCVGGEQPRLGPALRPKARQPREQIDSRIPEAAVLPVDEYRAGAVKADVVAPHVKVNESLTIKKFGEIYLGYEWHDGIQPAGRPEASSQERFRRGCDSSPVSHT